MGALLRLRSGNLVPHPMPYQSLELQKDTATKGSLAHFGPKVRFLVRRNPLCPHGIAYCRAYGVSTSGVSKNPSVVRCQTLERERSRGTCRNERVLKYALFYSRVECGRCVRGVFRQTLEVGQDLSVPSLKSSPDIRRDSWSARKKVDELTGKLTNREVD